MSASSLHARVRKKILKARVAWSRRTRLPIRAGLAIGCLLVVFGAYGLYQRFHTTHQGGGTVAVSTKTLTESTNNPDETPVKDYKVAADMPRQISIPAIRAKGFIQKVAADTKNAIVVPNNVHMAGWYVKTPKPGERGVSIVVGHVQGKYANGVFRNLSKVKSGDEITVEFGDHSTRRFIAKQVNVLSVDDTSKAQYENVTNTATQLTLITCGGKYNRQDHSYEKRVIVRAALQP